MAPRPGWKSSFDDTLYELSDPRLNGLGNPPGDPGWCEDPANAGRGLGRLLEVTIDDDAPRKMENTKTGEKWEEPVVDENPPHPAGMMMGRRAASNPGPVPTVNKLKEV